MIHQADPQSWPEMITIFTHSVCTSVNPSICRSILKISRKTKKIQVRVVIDTGGTMGLAEEIIDDTYVFNLSLFSLPTTILSLI